MAFFLIFFFLSIITISYGCHSQYAQIYYQADIIGISNYKKEFAVFPNQYDDVVNQRLIQGAQNIVAQAMGFAPNSTEMSAVRIIPSRVPFLRCVGIIPVYDTIPVGLVYLVGTNTNYCLEEDGYITGICTGPDCTRIGKKYIPQENLSWTIQAIVNLTDVRVRLAWITKQAIVEQSIRKALATDKMFGTAIIQIKQIL